MTGIMPRKTIIYIKKTHDRFFKDDSFSLKLITSKLLRKTFRKQFSFRKVIATCNTFKSGRKEKRALCT